MHAFRSRAPGTRLASPAPMARGLIVVTVGAAALLFTLSRSGDRTPGEGPLAVGEAFAAPADAREQPRDQVLLEHALVEVHAVAEPARAKGAVRRRPAPARASRASDPRTRESHSPSRVVRVLLGDGRYRPAPFPQPGN